MELDELRDILNQGEREEMETSVKKVDFSKKKTSHPIVKIRNKLVIENGIGLLIIGILLIISLLANINLPRMMAWGAICGGGIGLFYVIWKVWQIQRLINLKSNTKEFIEKALKAIKAYINLISYAILVFAPLGFIIGFTMGYYRIAEEQMEPLVEEFPVMDPLWLHVVLIMAFPIAFFFLVRIFYKALYGKQIKQLEELLQELDD